MPTNTGGKKSRKNEKAWEAKLDKVEEIARDGSLWNCDDDSKLLNALQKLEVAVKQMRLAWRSWQGSEEKFFSEPRSDSSELRKELVSKYGKETWHENAVFQDASGGGLYASERIESGEILFCIPKEAMFTLSQSNDPNETFSLATRLAGHVLEAQSEWSTYIQCLPRSFCLPLVWPLKSFLRLFGSESLGMAANSRRAADSLYCKYCQAYRRKIPGVKLLSYELFIWALAAVITRQNAIPSDDTQSTKKTSLALVPGWDLCNHELSGPSTAFRTDAFLELKAIKSIEAGEQIYMSYGDRLGQEFTVHSGFLPDVSSHRISLHISLADQAIDHAMAKLILNILIKAGCTPKCPNNFNFKGTLFRQPGLHSHIVLDQSLTAISLAVVAKDKSRLTYLMRSGHFSRWQPMDDDHRAAALHFLRLFCEKEAACRTAARAGAESSFEFKQLDPDRPLLDLCDHQANPNALASALWEAELCLLLDVALTTEIPLHFSTSSSAEERMHDE